MAEGAYQKCGKIQGNRTWAEEWATPVERSQGHTAAALLGNEPQVRLRVQRHCGRPGGGRDLESHSIPVTGGDLGRSVGCGSGRAEGLNSEREELLSIFVRVGAGMGGGW